MDGFELPIDGINRYMAAVDYKPGVCSFYVAAPFKEYSCLKKTISKIVGLVFSDFKLESCFFRKITVGELKEKKLSDVTVVSSEVSSFGLGLMNLGVRTDSRDLIFNFNFSLPACSATDSALEKKTDLMQFLLGISTSLRYGEVEGEGKEKIALITDTIREDCRDCAFERRKYLLTLLKERSKEKAGIEISV